MTDFRGVTPDQSLIELLDRIQARVARAIPDVESTLLFDELMDEAQNRGLAPLQCLDFIEQHRP